MLRCNRATVGAPPAVSPAPPPPHRFHRNPVSGHAAPATASASVELPLQLLSLPISSGSFLSLLPGGGGLGGWEAATRGGASLPTSRQHASSDHLMSRFSIHRREWRKRNLLLFSVPSPNRRPACHCCPAPNERHLHIYERSPVFTYTDTHTHSESRQ